MSADGGEETVQVTRADWEAMQERMARLEQVAGLPESVPAVTSTNDRRTDRRGLLKHGALLAAGAMAGSAVAVVSQAAPAEAANGSNLVLGSGSNVATAATGMEVNGTLVAYGLGVTDNGLGALPAGTSGAIFGHAKDQAWSVGVSGYAEAESVGVAGHSVGGIGVYGVSTGGTGVTGTTQASGASAVLGLGQGAASYGLVGSGGAAALRLAGGSAGPPPLRTDDHVSGEIDPDGNDGVWLCVVDGTPGSWVRLGAPGAAGALTVLASSVRVYDSRPGQAPTSVGPKTPLVGGTPRAVDTTANSSGVPAGANAVLINLTAVPRSGSGFLAAFKAGISFPGTSTLNWSATGNPIANAAVVALGAGKINLQANASTDVIVDVVGYYQ